MVEIYEADNIFDLNQNEDVDPGFSVEFDPGYDVYVKVDEQNRIVQINSNAFISDFSDWILIESGVYGERGHHAQGNYFPQPVYTDDGIPRYKLVDGKAQERTEEEIQADRDALPPAPPTISERVTALENKGDEIWSTMAQAIKEGVNEV